MLTTKNLPFLASLAFLAAACSAPQPDAKICRPLSTVYTEISARNAALARPGLTPAEAEAALGRYSDQCVRRWAYRLKASSQPVEAVANATLTACAREIDVAADIPAAAPGGCPTCQARDQAREALMDRARLAVIEARTGQCSTPDDASAEDREPTPVHAPAFAAPAAKSRTP